MLVTCHQQTAASRIPAPTGTRCASAMQGARSFRCCIIFREYYGLGWTISIHLSRSHYAPAAACNGHFRQQAGGGGFLWE